MKPDFSHVSFISAGAGSGKTYYLTNYLKDALIEERAEPGGIVATTFTVKAAGEIEQQVRTRLIEDGHYHLEPQMGQVLIGTVHSVCERLLQRFSFELGLSPHLRIVAIDDASDYFHRSLDEVLDVGRVRSLNRLGRRLGLDDWAGVVKKIVDEARGNDIPAADLKKFGPDNADALLHYFPNTADGDLKGELIAAVDNALTNIDVSLDKTKTTRNYLASLRDVRGLLDQPDCPWVEWIRLSKWKAAKASDAPAASVREAASRYAASPVFQQDIRSYIEELFDIAGQSLQRFQEIKTERGLIDFTDMEQLTLHALDNQAAQERLRSELQLLLVDEFQDTNPMQLAVFMKLARLANDVVFVGDVKQAIYAFRGCDPDLVFRMLEDLTEKGGSTEVLPYSWRSTPPLVRYINAVFSKVFEERIPPDRVILEPKREAYADEPAVMHWALSRGKLEEQVMAIASGVAALVDADHRIIDPDTKAERPARWGDIAILARTNDHVEKLAAALTACRVPMKMTLPGLSQTPEVCLARACLRCLNDPADTLATAEVIALGTGHPAESWLANRMAYLEEQSKEHFWGEDTYPVIRTLKALRQETGHQSPLETVAKVLNHVDIRKIVTAWGPDETKAAQRQRNLDAFLNLAVQYESHSEGQQEAASLTGFLLWLESPRSPELDLQPTITSGNAVHVLTYHRAKGLEWPVVITTDFFQADRSRLWDVRVEGDDQHFDLDQPLANRTIRYWPNVFGSQSKDVPVLDAIESSEEGQRCRANDEFELKRLAYVGLSRARDLIIIPMPDQNRPAQAWIHNFDNDYLIPDSDSMKLPGGHIIPTKTRAIDTTGTALTQPSYAPRWFEDRETGQIFLPEVRIPSHAEPVEDARVVDRHDFDHRLALRGTPDMRDVGLALHAAIAAELVDSEHQEAEARARSLLETHGVAGCLEARDAIEVAHRFREYLIKTFEPNNIWVEWPISHSTENGQLIRGWVDVLVETESGLVVIDHKSSPRPRSEWEQEALEYSGQLMAYKRAIELTGKPVIGTWIHFPVSGGLLKIATGHDGAGGARKFST
jgi:ATP-dependent exoDNAse (exonuclease V) beta subunit